MAEKGRYDYDITTGNRSYGDKDRDDFRGRDRSRESGGGSSRSGGSIFGGSSRGDDERGGDQGSEGWTRERENFSWGRGRDKNRDDDHRCGGGQEMGGGGRDQGERMSSGWGTPLELRDRDRIRGGHDDDRDSERDRERSERERGYGPDDRRDGLPIDETSRLIGSNKVEGTAVYGRDGHRLGSIYNFMVDKRSGNVEYAVMSYGGMLGMGQRYYPLPWEMLTYDTREGGYRIEMTERDLRDAPSFDRDTEPHFDGSYNDKVHSWYGTGRRR